MPDHQGPRIVAHRGASHDAPENTLAAFNLAWQQNADAIEGDFFLTADRQIACIHDDETSRLAGKKLIVEDSTLAELRRLDVGKWKAAKWEGEKIPLLREVLETVPDRKAIVIELKSKKKIVPVLMDELARFNEPAMDILIITFDAATAAECKTLMPQHPVHWLTGIDEDASPMRIADTVKKIGADGVGMEGNVKVIDADFVARLNDGGCDEFHVWTVDDVADAKYFQQLGAIGITTNKPALIGAAMRVN
jgi:glycerophosphoryl diester phosphodiesterase